MPRHFKSRAILWRKAKGAGQTSDRPVAWRLPVPQLQDVDAVPAQARALGQLLLCEVRRQSVVAQRFTETRRSRRGRLPSLRERHGLFSRLPCPAWVMPEILRGMT